jgi:acyl-CoA reductase-like NAD-dependent aldehyde dehydrogenase
VGSIRAHQRLTRVVVLDAALGEILTTAAKADWIINHGAEAISPERRKTSLMLSYKSSEVHYEPLGVVAAITSWNYRTYAQVDSASHVLTRRPSAAQCLGTDHGCPVRRQCGRLEVL